MADEILYFILKFRFMCLRYVAFIFCVVYFVYCFSNFTLVLCDSASDLPESINKVNVDVEFDETGKVKRIAGYDREEFLQPRPKLERGIVGPITNAECLHKCLYQHPNYLIQFHKLHSVCSCVLNEEEGWDKFWDNHFEPFMIKYNMNYKQLAEDPAYYSEIRPRMKQQMLETLAERAGVEKSYRNLSYKCFCINMVPSSKSKG